MKANIDKRKAWYVVMTNVKGELKAATNLHKAGFDYYLPRQRIEKWNKRTNTYREIDRPLMPRYLFVGMPVHNQAFGFARACDGVERFLGDQENRPIRVPAGLVEEIFIAEIDMQFDDTRAARIHRDEEAKTAKENTARRFPGGSDVTVTDGPFASFHGVVDEVTTRGTVKALVQIFGRWSAVEFEPTQLSPAA